MISPIPKQTAIVKHSKKIFTVQSFTGLGFSDVAFTSIQRECWVFLLLVQDAAVHH